jgi:hypothetical protein
MTGIAVSAFAAMDMFGAIRRFAITLIDASCNHRPGPIPRIPIYDAIGITATESFR